MNEYQFNTPTNQTIARELLIAYLNVGDHSSPKWSPIGKHVTDSSAEMDWSNETNQDIIGETYTKKKKPIITQGFDPWELTGGDEAQQKIYNLAVVQQNAQALTSQDMLIVHFYASKGGEGDAFAERYESCSIDVSSLGGEGGGNIAMPIEVTYGGTRTIGTAKNAGGEVTFTPDASAVSLSTTGKKVNVEV